MRDRYENLDGFRAFAAIGIIITHVRDNGGFRFSGFVLTTLISSFSLLPLLFMLLSAFSMCCGYYERFRNGTISLEQFYSRRYSRIWPFFALLCTLELIVDHSLSSLYEWFADLTLAFGLLPNASISVVGVGWFIGVVFVFYMLFPFFVFLMWNKKRAWIVLLTAIVFNALCKLYFFDEAHVVSGFKSVDNIVYCFMFFAAGGLIYLYRETIKRQNALLIGCLTVACVLFYYLVNWSAYTALLLLSLLTALGICAGKSVLLQNRVVRFISGLSMEIYLCHMFVFRTIEKLHLIHVTGNEIVNYCLASVATFCGAVIMAFVMKRALAILTDKNRKAA